MMQRSTQKGKLLGTRFLRKAIVVVSLSMITQFGLLVPCMAQPVVRCRGAVKLVAPDGQCGDVFGRRVTLSRSFAAVGTPTHSAGGVMNSGAIYVFARAGMTWAFDQKLVPAGSAVGDHLSACAIRGSRLAAGATQFGSGTHRGAAYIFERGAGGWTETASLAPVIPQENGDVFGASVSIHSNRVIVGAPQNQGAGSGDGFAVVFAQSPGSGSWVQEGSRLLPTTDMETNWFGVSVSIEGEVAVIGAPQDGSEGAAYVFQRDSEGEWLQVQKLVPGPNLGGKFGAAVSLSGDRIAVGAPAQSSRRGRVHVYVREGETWALEAIRGAEMNTGADFGNAVSLDGDCLVVGAVNSPGGMAATGAAYVYDRLSTGWTLRCQLMPDALAVGDRFGSSVAVFGSSVLVGCDTDDDALPSNSNCNSGSAHFFPATQEGVPALGPFAVTVLLLVVGAYGGRKLTQRA